LILKERVVVAGSFDQARSRNRRHKNAPDLVRGLLACADMGSEFGDLGADSGAQRRKGSDDRDSNQRCGNSVFRQLKTGFIAKEFPNHFVFAPFRFGYCLIARPLFFCVKESSRVFPLMLMM
jgi:hypothetical protein